MSIEFLMNTFANIVFSFLLAKLIRTIYCFIRLKNHFLRYVNLQNKLFDKRS